jgi:hypothetical protein
MRKSTFVALLVAGSLLIPAAVYASHQFTDVPNSNQFHTAIGWMKDNNITVGCNPPANTRYCPDDNVTREQMAAFMKRLAENQVVDAALLDGYDYASLVPGSTPPVGTTIRGTFHMGGTGAAGFALSTSEISFGYDFGAAPTPHFIELGDSPVPECPGTQLAPEAAPGHLCVYERLNLNAGLRNVNGPNGDGSTYPFGARLFMRSAAAGDFYSQGTWAATKGPATLLGNDAGNGQENGVDEG